MKKNLAKIMERNETHARQLLEAAEEKIPQFALRTNISYTGKKDDECPIKGKALSFEPNEFIHIKDKHNHDWWVGRLVKEGCICGFVPSPSKFEARRQLLLKQAIKRHKMNAIKSRDAVTRSLDDGNTFPGNGNENETKEFRSQFTSSTLPAQNSRTRMTTATETLPKDGQAKAFFKRHEPQPAYDIVPVMRPVVFCGPSLKGYEVTDMMQKAVFDFLKNRFEGRISIVQAKTDLSLAKLPGLNNAVKKNVIDRSLAKPNLVEVDQEVERIFEISRSCNLLVLDAGTINHPAQLARNPLAPIIVAIKIISPKVLQKLIKTRPADQKKALNIQMVAAEKLAQCNPDLFDIILDENKLDEASEHLADYLEAYWRASRSPANMAFNSSFSRIGNTAPSNT